MSKHQDRKFPACADRASDYHSHCYFLHISPAALFWLMGAIITRSALSWWDLNCALLGEMMRALMHRLCREDMFGQVCVYIWAVWVPLLHLWVKYSGCWRRVSSLLWVLCMSFNWATLSGHSCTSCSDQRGRQTVQHWNLNKPSLVFEI